MEERTKKRRRKKNAAINDRRSVIAEFFALIEWQKVQRSNELRYDDDGRIIIIAANEDISAYTSQAASHDSIRISALCVFDKFI